MKDIKLKIVSQSIIMIFICSNFLFAQSPFRIGAGFNVVFPLGDYTQIAKTGTGGSIIMDYSLSPEIAISLSSSFSSLKSKIPQIGIDSRVIDFSIKSIDVLLGGRYYFYPSFFGLAEGGVSYMKLHADIYKATDNSSEKESSDYEPYSTFGVGIGYRYNLVESKSDLEFSGIYHFVEGDAINFPAFLLRASIMIYL